MAKDVDVLQAERVNHVVRVLGQAADLVAVLRLIGLAMAAHVDRDHPVAVGQAAQLVLELLGGLRPAGDHQDRLTRPGLEVVQIDAIAGSDLSHPAGDLRAGGPACRRRRQRSGEGENAGAPYDLPPAQPPVQSAAHCRTPVVPGRHLGASLCLSAAGFAHRRLPHPARMMPQRYTVNFNHSGTGRLSTRRVGYCSMKAKPRVTARGAMS
jgi:hypothetical protein